MELAEEFGRWSATVSVCDDVSSKVLKSLKAMHVKVRDAREERIAVIDKIWRLSRYFFKHSEKLH